MPFEPGRQLYFLHMHMDHVQGVRVVQQHFNEERDSLYQIEVPGKVRPMVLLWERRENERRVFAVLKKTRSRNRLIPGLYVVYVENDRASFVDCSRWYEYSDTVRSHSDGGEAQRLPERVWRKVLQKLPQPVRDYVTEAELQHRMRSQRA